MTAVPKQLFTPFTLAGQTIKNRIAPYGWLPFDRKYVIRPPLDYGLTYPVALVDPKWTTSW